MFLDPRFKTALVSAAAAAAGRPRAAPIVGHAWERVLAEACSAYDPAKRLEWDPKSNRSGVDVLYDGIGYSCKTTRFRSAEHPRRVVTPSYKLARCRTHADAILEIDRPHRHNFQFYAILARKHADGDADGAIQYEVHTPSSELTLARRFDWDMQDGRLLTDWRDGVRMEIRMDAGKRRLVVTWTLGDPVIEL